MLGWVLGVDEVSNPFDGRRLKVVQSANGICSSVHTRNSFFLASFFSPPVFLAVLYPVRVLYKGEVSTGYYT